jgi:hypothetical protein
MRLVKSGSGGGDTYSKLGAGSINEEIEQILRRIEHYHKGSMKSYRILYQDVAGLGGEVSWDEENAEIVATR